MDAILETFGGLLRIAQIESGMPARRFTKVNLSELLRTVVEVYQPMAEEKEQLFTADVTAGLTVWGDRELLMQMMANVIENAMKHSPRGASIDLLTGETPNTIAVAVNDGGPGIPAEERAQESERARLLMELQQIRLGTHRDGWFETVKEKARAIADIRRDAVLRDQYAAAFGGINYIRFNPGHTVDVEPVPCRAETIEQLESHILLFYTNQKRDADSILQKQSAGTKDKMSVLRAMRDLAWDAFYAPVVTRFATYQIKLNPDAQKYCDAIRALPAMHEWERAARIEVEAT